MLTSGTGRRAAGRPTHGAHGRGARGTRQGRAGHEAGAAGPRARGRRHGLAGYDTADPGCDTAGPRATIRPLCATGRACARLGVLSWARLGVLCTLTQFFTRFDSVLFLSH